MKVLIRHRMLCLIWICTVCLCSIKRTQCINGIIRQHFLNKQLPSVGRHKNVFQLIFWWFMNTTFSLKVSKGAKIRNRYNQVPHLIQDTNGKVTNSQLDTTNERQEVSPLPAGDHKAHINRCAQRHSKHKTEQKHKKIHKRSTAFERSVKYFTGALKLV